MAVDRGVSLTVIDVQNLIKTYGALHAVDGISFEVQRGEIFAFLGPNGAGKTTTIEILQGLRKPTNGTALVLGYDITKPAEVQEIKRKIGVLPQDFNALDKLTVKENIALFAKMYSHAKRPEELMEMLGVQDKAKVKFEELSGGLKQRVGIAVALVNDPELVFLDEPTTGLDPKARRDVWRVIMELKKAGKTVFLTTHYMEEAEVLADRVAVIHRGRIAAIGKTIELLEKYGGERTLIINDVNEPLASVLLENLPDAKLVKDDVVVHLKDLGDLATALAIMAKRGVQKGIQLRNPSIENVFLRLVGAKLTEEGELA